MCNFNKKSIYFSHNISHRISTLIMVFFLMFLSVCTNAKATINLQNPVAVDLGVWSGKGDINHDSHSFCVRSSISGIAENYRVKITDPFVLEGDTADIPFTLIYEDTQIGSTETITAGSFSHANKTGLINCNSASNGKFSIIINETALQKAVAGHYSNTLAVEVEQLSTGNNATSTLTTSIIIPDLIRVSDISDIDLGIWDGRSDMKGSTSVCIFKNVAGSYSVTLTGSGDAGALTLTNGDKDIPYSVRYTDGQEGFKSINKGIALTGLSSSSQLLNCNNSTNSSLEIMVLNSTLAAFTPDRYLGVLTLLVAPE